MRQERCKRRNQYPPYHLSKHRERQPMVASTTLGCTQTWLHTFLVNHMEEPQRLFDVSLLFFRASGFGESPNICARGPWVPLRDACDP